MDPIETEKLYLEPALHFEGTLHTHSRLNGRPTMILDRSAFYGEAGGQLGDQGTLKMGSDTWQVVDCQYDSSGQLHHVLEHANDAPPVGARLAGQVAWGRRRDMMSQHTGQHLLSAVFAREADAETVSSRLGGTMATLDLDVKELDEVTVARVERIANSIVLENRPVRALYPNADQLAAMNLRRLPKVTKDIRIMEIDGYDLTPCGGTHCSFTGEIGSIYIVGKERYKGKLRFNFICGERVTHRLKRLETNQRRLGDLLGCGAAGVEEAIVKLQKDFKDQSRRLGEVRATLLKGESASLLDQHPPHESGATPIVLIRNDSSLDNLRGLSKALVKRSDVVAMLIGKDDNGDWRVVIDAGETSGFDAGGWFKSKGKELGGRGGGRPAHAEGRFPGSLDPHVLRLS